MDDEACMAKFVTSCADGQRSALVTAESDQYKYSSMFPPKLVLGSTLYNPQRLCILENEFHRVERGDAGFEDDWEGNRSSSGSSLEGQSTVGYYSQDSTSSVGTPHERLSFSSSTSSGSDFGSCSDSWSIKHVWSGTATSLRGMGTYELKDRIGRGTFGMIYSARNVQTGETVAVKGPPDNLDSLHEEISTTRSLATPGHCNLVAYIDEVMFDWTEMCRSRLVVELADCNLAEMASSQHCVDVPLAAVVDLARQGFAALSYLHGSCYLHRDVSMANIMADLRRGLLKLGDFGMTTKLEPTRISHSVERLVELRKMGTAIASFATRHKWSSDAHPLVSPAELAEMMPASAKNMTEFLRAFDAVFYNCAIRREYALDMEWWAKQLAADTVFSRLALDIIDWKLQVVQDGGVPITGLANDAFVLAVGFAPSASHTAAAVLRRFEQVATPELRHEAHVYLKSLYGKIAPVTKKQQ